MSTDEAILCHPCFEWLPRHCGRRRPLRLLSHQNRDHAHVVGRFRRHVGGFGLSILPLMGKPINDSCREINTSIDKVIDGVHDIPIRSGLWPGLMSSDEMRSAKAVISSSEAWVPPEPLEPLEPLEPIAQCRAAPAPVLSARLPSGGRRPGKFARRAGCGRRAIRAQPAGGGWLASCSMRDR